MFCCLAAFFISSLEIPWPPAIAVIPKYFAIFTTTPLPTSGGTFSIPNLVKPVIKEKSAPL